MEDLLGDDLVTVRLRVPEREVVYVKGVIEASEGLASVFAGPRPPGDATYDGGALVVAAPRSRRADLLDVIADLRAEVSLWEDASG